MKHEIESMVTLDSGYDIPVRFNYTVTSHYDIPARVFGLPENCSPAEFEFLFDVEELQISNYSDKWWNCESEKLIDLIIDKLNEEVYEHYQKNI